MSDNTTSLKRCTKCGNEFPETLEYFYKHDRGHNGLLARCITCTRAALRIRAARRKEKQKIYETEYRKSRGQEMDKNRALQDANNPEARRNRNRRASEVYRQKHPAEIKARSNRYRSKLAGVDTAFTSDDWQRCLDYFNHRCAVCDRPIGLWHTLSMDHWIPLSKGGATTPGNIVPLCHGVDGCNNSKCDKDASVWLIELFGPRKAKSIKKRIETFLVLMKKGDSS